MISLPMSTFPRVQAGNYYLRRLKPGDSQEIFKLRSDDRVNEFLNRPTATTIEDGNKFIARINDGIDEGGSIYWAIVPDDETKLIGTICFWNIQKKTSKAEIGYELMPDYQGKGVMQQVVNAVLQFGFDVLKLRCVEAVMHPGNIKSIKILEKYGFQKDIIAEQALSDEEKEEGVVVYSLYK